MAGPPHTLPLGQGLGAPAARRLAGRAFLWARRQPAGVLGLLLVALVALGGLLAPWLAPYPPLLQAPAERLMPPGPGHLLGTDELGRDILSRLLFGARLSLAVALSATALGGALGGFVGLVSGYRLGPLDLVVQRAVDILMSFPLLVLAIGVVSALGPSGPNLVLAIALIFAPRVARVVRAAAVGARNLPYVEAARAVGASGARVLVHHIAPQCLAPFLVVVTAELGYAVLAESALSFLGFGLGEPLPSLGGMLGGSARLFHPVAPWMALAPGAVLAALVFGVNLLGDALRDLADPHLRP